MLVNHLLPLLWIFFILFFPVFSHLFYLFFQQYLFVSTAFTNAMINYIILVSLAFLVSVSLSRDFIWPHIVLL